MLQVPALHTFAACSVHTIVSSGCAAPHISIGRQVAAREPVAGPQMGLIKTARQAACCAPGEVPLQTGALHFLSIAVADANCCMP